jgi:uncharacterized membrane protein YcaP (DUF421 family)
MFFDNWSDLGRLVLVGTLAYFALVAVLRVSGKRTLAKMNAFDLVVTVALGSTLATVLLSKDVALVEGILAFALLAFLQYIVAWLATHSRQVEALVKAEPRMLLYQGRFLRANMKDERVTEDEVRQALRAQGEGDPARVRAVVLETDGSLSVLT